MAISAYTQVQPLDSDAHFHLSLLLRTGGEFQDALAIAQQALETDPDHLLNLGAAADAAAAMGDVGSANAYYRRFLELYDQERAKALPEYDDHEPWFDGARQRATQVPGG